MALWTRDVWNNVAAKELDATTGFHLGIKMDKQTCEKDFLERIYKDFEE